MMNMFEGICGKVAPGLCRLSMSGSALVDIITAFAKSQDAPDGEVIDWTTAPKAKPQPEKKMGLMGLFRW